jgi:hypothetical protein
MNAHTKHARSNAAGRILLHTFISDAVAASLDARQVTGVFVVLCVANRTGKSVRTVVQDVENAKRV